MTLRGAGTTEERGTRDRDRRGVRIKSGATIPEGDEDIKSQGDDKTASYPEESLLKGSVREDARNVDVHGIPDVGAR